MTDPVDTDALRDLSRRMRQEWPIDETWTEADAGKALVAAADEVDRLRAELDQGLELTKKYAEDNAREKRLLERDVSRLRAVIEDAPHAGDIGVCNRDRSGYSPHLVCTCWKVDAL